MQFAVEAVRRPRDTVLQITGELDIATVKQLSAAVSTVLAERPPLVLLDLTPTRFLDSTGCRELVRSAKACAAAEVPVEVVVPAANWRVRRVVDFVHLSELIPVHDELPVP